MNARGKFNNFCSAYKSLDFFAIARFNTSDYHFSVLRNQCDIKMFGKHFLLALLVGYSSNFASTHIVTSAHTQTDLAFVSCVNSLTNVVQTTLCPIYGQMQIGQYSMEQILHPALDPREMESRSWEFRNNIRRCCTRPCTIAELVAKC